MSAFYTPESAMAIVAHPDDIEFGCTGTIARWVKGGARVAYVLCTSGDVGIDEPGMTRERATEIREAETRAAAAVAGVTEVVFLREPDGLLQATLELRKKLVREIRRFRPEVVVCGDPTIVLAGDVLLLCLGIRIADQGKCVSIHFGEHRGATGMAIARQTAGRIALVF